MGPSPPCPPPHSPCSSDKDSEVDPGVRHQQKDDLNVTRKSHSSYNASIASEKYEETYIPKVCAGNCTSCVSPCSKHGGGKDGLLLPVFNDLVKEFDFAAANSGFSPRMNVETPRSDVDTPKAFRTSEMEEHEQEIRHLRSTVRMLRERERNLEVQLLEYYGLKEQETAVMELQNQLKINTMEAKLFTLKIESLEAENRRLEAQVADHAKVVAELEATRAKIKILKKKLRFEAEQNKEQIITLKKRVEKFHDSGAADNSEIQLKLRRLKDLEGEAEELRKSNFQLQIENSELARTLESTQILANSILEDPEAEALKEVSARLRQENEDLTKEIQQLQVDRCSDVEELVYLRWINACLRYELRNFQPPTGKTAARDLSKSLSPRSEEKAKQLIVEYANTEGMGEKGMMVDFDSDQWSSSHASFFTDSPEFDDFSVDNSSATKTNTHQTGYAEDNESPYCSSSKSTAAYAGPEGQSNVFATSRSSSRASLDLPRWRSPKQQDIKDVQSVQRNSDVGSSSWYKTFSREGSADLPLKSDQDSDSTEKAELAKYAEALMSSRGATPKQGNGVRGVRRKNPNAAATTTKTTATAATTTPVDPLQKVSLYVGDLDPQVTEDDLLGTFRFIGPIASVRLCRNAHSGESLRYAYVNFYSHSHASKAMACLNHTELKGKTMRIMWSQRDALPRKTGIANIFVKNLDTSVTSTQLQDMFGDFGTILSCKVAEENGKSKGFGFVQFDTEDSAMAAVSALNDTVIMGKNLYVSKFVKKSERLSEFTNLYVKNLDEDVTEDLLEEKFSLYGRVDSLAIMKDANRKSRGFGFVNFESQEEAKKAIEAMNGALLGTKHLFVGRAQKKAEREKLLNCKNEMLNSPIEKLRSSNLYVKNLAEYVDNKKLEKHFSAFGKIESVKVMCYDNGRSKGFGFVCFSTPEEAVKALNTLNGTIFEGRKLYVAVAQRKEDRCRDLQNYFYHQLPQRSFQPPNWTILPPLQYSVSPSPPMSPPLHQPVMYPTFGTNVDAQYPLVSQNFSWIPSRQAQWASTRNENFQKNSRTYAKCNVHAQDMNSVNHGGHEAGNRKKGYKQSGPTGSSRSAATGGRAENSKTTSRARHHPLSENLEHGHAAQITRTSDMLLEMNNSVKEAQVLKVANGSRTSADHRPVFAKCRSYLT
ncbi:polyadenylate-binding protein 4-like isoform X1 [Prunus yedoensis var. nudiflora]|uniref:Polyadenylate-binding protein 4-like isoform X1 n=1 Tax=Prunus yedoensis var. nudiflora TaxID=2094558 RepID=A0A314YL16_PRUYE|nr:polyadenylate-binding protein 4-like isoform X1 [Prunus yedoensis var. nudiflora]